MADFVAYKGNRINKQSVFVAPVYKSVNSATTTITLPSVGQLYPLKIK